MIGFTVGFLQVRLKDPLFFSMLTGYLWLFQPLLFVRLFSLLLNSLPLFSVWFITCLRGKSMIFLILGIALIFAFLCFVRFKHFKKVVKMFDNHSVAVFGPRGSGKDMLFSNVSAYLGRPYCSNVRYTKNDKLWIPFRGEYLELGGNRFENFVSGNIIKFEHPLPDKTNIYISDAGIYYPSQYCDKLNKLYPEVPLSQALLRHLIDAQLHFNVQALNRVWDKFREQQDRYILCDKCKVYFGLFVKQSVIVYDKYEAALNKVRPFNLRRPIFNKNRRQLYEIQKQSFYNSNGNVERYRLFYFKKSRYDSRRFSSILSEGSTYVD